MPKKTLGDKELWEKILLGFHKEGGLGEKEDITSVPVRASKGTQVKDVTYLGFIS